MPYVTSKYKNYSKIENGEVIEANKQRNKSRPFKEKYDEINEVQQLGSEIVTISKHSNIVEKLQLKRKLRHDSLLKKLADELNKLNLEIEENIRMSSEEVKAHLETDRNHLTELLKTLNVSEVASYHESVFLDIQKKVDEMKSNQLRLVQDLYEDLSKAEDLRAKENEKIFRSIFQEIEKTAYISSYEVQYFAEQEAMKMNQLSLNNRRCFEDLKLKLVLRSEYTFKSFMDEVFCLREKWVRFNLQEAADNLQMERVEKRVITPPDPEIRMELKGHELTLHLSSDGCYNLVKEEEWFENIKRVIKEVENYKKMVIELFRKIILAVHRNMGNDCDDIRKTILSLNVLLFEERSVQPILFEEFGESAEIIEDLENFWQDTLNKVRNEMENTIDFLNGFGNLWTDHIRRFCESKILVLRAVEKVEENNKFPLQELEAKLNLNLDLLRQEYNTEKLETSYRTVINNLEGIKEKLEFNYINETSVAEEFYKMMILEADVLSSDINEFIYTKYPCSPKDEGKIQQDNQSLPQIVGTKFGATIHEFSLGMNSLTFWKSEVNRDLEHLSNNAREMMKWKAEEWCENKIREISRKYQIQLEMHNKRYERVRNQIYEVRLQEIRMHQEVFDKHKAAVDEICKTLALEVEGLFQKGLEKLDKSRMKVASVVEEAKKEEKAEIVKCIQAQITKEKSDFISDFAAKSEQVRGEIGQKISLTQQSNLKFMKSIKLFHENGNYDAEEAKIYINALESIDKESGTQSKYMVKDTGKKESEITQKASEMFDEAIRTFSQLYEELRFNSDVRHIIDLYELDFKDLEANLKADFDFFNKQYDCLANWIVDETVFLSEEQDEMWVVVISSIYKNLCDLFYELELPLWQGNSEGDLSDSEVDSSKAYIQDLKLKNGKDVGLPPKADCPVTDFSEDLFQTDFLTGNNSSFVKTASNEILHFISVIQKIGCMFYKNLGNKSLIRKDLLKPNYEDFGLGIFQTFRLFGVRSEQVWLKAIQDFLPLLGQVKTSFKIYFERRIRECSEKILTALDNFKEDFIKCLITSECNLKSELKNFDDRLLPLHGHPRNKQLLDSLEEEVVQKTAELELNWEFFIKKYKVELKNFRTFYMKEYPEWQKLKHFYSKCEGYLFADITGRDVVKVLNTIIEKQGFVKKPDKTSHGEKETFLANAAAGNTNLHPRDWQNLNYLNAELLRTDEYFMDIKRIVDRETLDDCYKADNDWNTSVNLFEPKIELLQDPEDLNELTAPCTIRVETRCQELKELIYSKSNIHKEITTEWLDKWKSNVARITELYTVKYSHIKELSNQSSELNKDKGKQLNSVGAPKGDTTPQRTVYER